MYEKDVEQSVSEPFLAKGRLDERSFAQHTSADTRRQRGWCAYFHLVAYALLLASVSLNLYTFGRSRWPIPSNQWIPNLVPSPLIEQGAIKYEIRKLPLTFLDSPYAGDPSPELDLAWHNLFENVNIRVEGEVLEQLGLSSIPLSTGGYAAQLGVYHELHCIKKIRQWVFKDHYVLSKNLTQAELDEWPAHINHCIEMLRLSVMCRGDTSISTFKWIDVEGGKKPSPADRGLHQCIQWDKMADWVHERAIDIEEPGLLVHNF